MRNRLVAGNWKMNKTPIQTDVFINRFLELVDSNHAAEILLLPPFTSLDWAGKLLAGVGISLGAQDLYFEP
ncbi:triose-phosphate isomerase, partial [Candidatus Bipolaricaulota bacterium]|nr:triose-phosphate isomerase [Candidatus Bipolaricaulota bacterium]